MIRVGEDALLQYRVSATKLQGRDTRMNMPEPKLEEMIIDLARPLTALFRLRFRRRYFPYDEAHLTEHSKLPAGRGGAGNSCRPGDFISPSVSPGNRPQDRKVISWFTQRLHQ